MRHIVVVSILVATLLMVGTTVMGASAHEQEGPVHRLAVPVVSEDPVGDVPGGEGPDFESCGVSQPASITGSLLRFSFEFVSDPPLAADLETWSTDELSLGVAVEPDAVFPDDAKYGIIVHGVTLPQEADTGAPLVVGLMEEEYDVFERVVDVAVDGSTVTLSVDRKPLGDPEAVYFFAAVSVEGQAGSTQSDVCPDEDKGPGEYSLFG